MSEPQIHAIESESDWLHCRDPLVMEEFLSESGSERRWRLFACLCCWRVLPMLDERCRQAVAIAERFADGRATPEERNEALHAAQMAVLDSWQPGGGRAVTHAATAAVQALAFPRRSSAHVISASPRERQDGERAAQCDLLRELFANPFRPFVFNPAWRTPLVTAMASHVYEREAFDELPILADALDDAGCDVAHLLAHLREPTTHYRGCRALDAILGKD